MKNHDFAYMRIYEKIRDDIVKGAYKSGDRLPSKRTIAESFASSVITAEHAYAILCDEGYIEARERSGYFVIYREKDCFPVSHQGERDIFIPENHHTAPGDFPFSVFAKTARRVLSEYGDALLMKSPGAGLPELRDAVSAYLARSRGIFVSPENIIIGAGAEYLYTLIVQLLGRDKIYGLENPSYDKIRKVYAANGAGYELLTMGADGILSEELAKTSADILHITPFNSFPSGITASASKRREYIRWAKERGGILIEDDFDSEFSALTKTEDTVFSLDDGGSVIYMNTFSKTIAPSIRMGYMVLPDPLLESFRKKAGFYSCTVSAFEQHIIAEFISCGDFERHINKVRRQRRIART